MIVLPTGTLERWQMAHKADSLLGWRALSHLMLAEARVRVADNRMDMAADLMTLADVAMRRALDLQPVREAA